MKTSKTISMAVTILALMTAVAVAQPNGLRADVPFAFRAGDTVFPAGNYSVTVDTVAQRIEIRSNTGSAMAFVPAPADFKSQASEQTVLRFNCYGDSYFLKKIEVAGRTDVRVLPATSAEREMALTAQASQVAIRGGAQ